MRDDHIDMDGRKAIVSTDMDRLEDLIQVGDLNGAQHAADAIPRPTDPDGLWRLARAFDLHLGRAEEAEQLYREAAPASMDALVDLSLLLDEQGREDAADRELRSQSADVEATARVLRGRHYRAHNRPRRALAEYERGVELESTAALRYLAGTLSFLGRPGRAEQLYRQGPFRSDDEFGLDYADFLRDRGRVQEAETLVQEVADRGSEVAERVLGDLLGEHPDRRDDAVAHYLAAIMLGDRLAITNLGVEWRDQGRHEEAAHALRAATGHGDALAARSLNRLPARDEHVPAAWCAHVAELVERPDRAPLPDPSLADLVTTLQAAQVAHLAAHGASPEQIDEHLRCARWIR